MAFSKADDFLEKLFDITAKVERMRDDVVRLADDIGALRERIERLEAGGDAGAQVENIATLRKNRVTQEPTPAERQRLEAASNQPTRSVDAGKAARKSGGPPRVAATAPSGD